MVGAAKIIDRMWRTRSVRAMHLGVNSVLALRDQHDRDFDRVTWSSYETSVCS